MITPKIRPELQILQKIQSKSRNITADTRAKTTKAKRDMPDRQVFPQSANKTLISPQWRHFLREPNARTRIKRPGSIGQQD